MKSSVKKFLKVSGYIILVLVVIRLSLPPLLLHFANKNLARMKGYYGHIKDIDLALFRGAYNIDSLYILKTDSVNQAQTPFFSASQIDLSVEWKALLHGSLVGELEFTNPEILFTKEKVEPAGLQKDSTQFEELLRDFMPLRVNRFAVYNGTIRYKDENTSPPVDIKMTQAYVIAKNLRSSYPVDSLLPARIAAHASLYDGSLSFNMALNPLAPQPTFDLNAELKETNLVKLNEFFQAYARADVNRGIFGLYTEAAAKEGRFSGYVKPIVKDMDILGHDDKPDNFFQKVWEGTLGTVSKILTNPPEEQVATKILFSGNIKNPDSNVWYTVVQILKNAFIRALEPSLDDEISISSVDKS